MRDIKFRGQRLDNGEWIYGSYMKMADNGEFTHNIMADHVVKGKHCWSATISMARNTPEK